MNTRAGQSAVITKRARPYKPRVRSGCITCKIRRVKCDETKPACLRCTSTGRKCDGFAPPKALMFEICENDREKRSFHYFREKTTIEICSYDASRFWNRLVLQASYACQPVRHALVAIGSFHESLESKQASITQFTVEQYNKAINALTKNASQLSVNDVLMSCIIFVFFENIQGHFDTALRHLRNGLQILFEWRTKQLSSESKAHPAIEDELAGILDALQVQASVLLTESRMKPRHELKNEQEQKNDYTSSLPESLTSLHDAHHYFYQLVHWTCENLERVSKNESLETQDAALTDIRDAFAPPQCALRFFQWHSMMETDIGAKIDMTVQEKVATRLGVIHLEIQYHIVIIMLRCLPFKNEMVFDQQEKNFHAILDLVREFLKLSTTPNFDLSRVAQLTGFDIFIIPPLHVVACRCRDPIIRREAIALLRSVRWLEDIWDSFDTASVAERIMLLEENGRDVKSSEEISKIDRLHLVDCSSFAYSEKLQRLELVKTHYHFDPEWVKMTCVRSHGEIEEIWLNRHGDVTLTSRPNFFPKDVDGLFPQVLQDDWSLFSLISTGHAARFMGRFHANNMFTAQHSRSAGTQGDFVTISGKFTEHLATDKHYY